MPWNYSFDKRAFKELKKLSKKTQAEIITFLDERIAGKATPKRFGKQLRKQFSGLWRYRIGAYRLICKIEEQKLIVLVLRVGHRSKVYR